MAKSEDIEKLLATGRTSLARCDWQNARAAFQSARDLADTPEVLEGLGAAAWWLDDAKTVFEARERAYQLYRQRGDRLGAGRVATAIGMDSFHFRGQVAVAKGWHRRAQSLLEGLVTTAEHAWLRISDCEIALAVGDDVARVRDVAAETAAIGRRLDDADIEMLAVAQHGLAQVLHGDVEAGIARLDEAATAALAGELTNPAAAAIACCHLMTACELVRDLGRAAEWCERLRDYSARTHFNAMVAVCRTQHASILMWSGAWAEAEAELERAMEQCPIARVRDPAVVRLVQLRLRQGRSDEAEALLTRIEWHAHARLLRAALALDRGDAESAAELARRFLQQAPASNRTDRALACELRVRAQIALGQPPDGHALEEIHGLAVAVGTDMIRAGASTVEGLVAASLGQPEHACDVLEDAIALFLRAGARHDAARARVELARALLALDRRAAACAEIEQAIRVFEELGAARDAQDARALRQSVDGSPPTSPAAPARPGGLTAREVDVLRLLTQGLTNREIATRLAVSEFTVKRHVANILTKLDLPTRSAAAAHAARAGWV